MMDILFQVSMVLSLLLAFLAIGNCAHAIDNMFKAMSMRFTDIDRRLKKLCDEDEHQDNHKYENQYGPNYGKDRL